MVDVDPARLELATFDQFAQAYEVFAHAAEQKALKVIISNT